LKSEGRLSTRLHLSHSAWFLTLTFSKTVFILTSPPQEHINFWVALDVREFLLAWAMVFSFLNEDEYYYTKKNPASVNCSKITTCNLTCWQI
jgi:hypothetical protein